MPFRILETKKRKFWSMAGRISEYQVVAQDVATKYRVTSMKFYGDTAPFESDVLKSLETELNNILRNEAFPKLINKVIG